MKENKKIPASHQLHFVLGYLNECIRIQNDPEFNQKLESYDFLESCGKLKAYMELRDLILDTFNMEGE